MHNTDLFSIVVAINHLSDAVQQIQDAAKEAGNVDVLKDYIMPVGTLVLSAVIAYYSAKSGYKWQDKFLTNKIKIDTINKTIMDFQNVQGTLLSIKANYIKNLGTHPLQRVGVMPHIIYSYKPLMINYEHLVQVIMTKDEDLHNNPWVHIASYVAIQDQFNQLNILIQERNTFDSQIKDHLASTYHKKSFTFPEVMASIDSINVQKYIELTELVINMVDNLIVSVDDFLKNFPQIAKELMGDNLSDHYKMINMYKNDSESVKKLQERTPPLDLNETAKLLGLTPKEVEDHFCDKSYTIQTTKIKSSTQI